MPRTSRFVAAGERRGFTLTELLVVIGVIAVLMGLLMPAISSARESARRTQCANNIKQIGLALASFESTAGRYPAGVASFVWNSRDRNLTSIDARAAFGFYHWTYFLHTLLPRLDEQAYYDGLGGPLFRKQGFESISNNNDMKLDWARVSGVPLPGLLCPSDGQAGSSWTPMDAAGLFSGNAGSVGTISLAKSNYLGFFSGTTVAESLAWSNTNSWSAGFSQRPVHPLPPPAAFLGTDLTAKRTDRRAVFGYARGTPLNAVKDGTMYTIAMGEYLRGVSDRDGRGAFWFNFAGMQSLQATTTPNSRTPDLLSNEQISDTNMAADWRCSTGSPEPYPSPNNRPDLNLPCVGSENTDMRQGKYLDNFAGTRSRHRDGVNVLFVDGHVSFIKDSIDGSTEAPYGTWQRLVWIDDGNDVGGEW